MGFNSKCVIAIVVVILVVVVVVIIVVITTLCQTNMEPDKGSFMDYCPL